MDEQQQKKLGIGYEKFAVGGESAGGGLAAALCIYARDKGNASIAFQMPLYPMLDDRVTKPPAATMRRFGTRRQTPRLGKDISARFTAATE